MPARLRSSRKGQGDDDNDGESSTTIDTSATATSESTARNEDEGPDVTAWTGETRSICFLLCSMTTIIYYRTACPSVAGGDSGELVAAGYLWSVAHPPGYPLYSVLLKIIINILPIGRIAWRANILSGLFSTIAAYFLYCTIHRIVSILWADKGEKRFVVANWSAFLGAASYAFTPLVWLYSTHAEVFPLNNAIVSWMLYLTTLYFTGDSNTRSRVPIIGAFAMGLGLAHQHTSVLFSLPIAAVMCISELGKGSFTRKPQLALQLILALVAGLSPYLYIPYVASHNIPHSWGAGETWAGFVHHFLRRDYGTLDLAVRAGLAQTMAGGVSGSERYLIYVKYCIEEGTYLLPVIALVGVHAALTCRRSYGITSVFVGLYIFYNAFFHTLANLPLNSPLYAGIVARFYMQPNLVVYLALGVGSAQLCAMLQSTNRFRVSHLAAVAAFLVAMQIGSRYSKLDQSDNYFIEKYGRSVLRSLPRNAMLIVRGDIKINSLRYLTMCEHFREDVDLIDLEMGSHEWYTPGKDIILPKLRPGMARTDPRRPRYSSKNVPAHDRTLYTLRDLFDANIDRTSIFLLGGVRPESSIGRQMNDDSLAQPFQHYGSFPYGFADVVYKIPAGAEVELDLESLTLQHHNALPTWSKLPLLDTNKWGGDTWEYMLQHRLWQCHHRLGWTLFFYGNVRKTAATKSYKLALDAGLNFLVNQPPTVYDVPSYVYSNYIKLTHVLMNQGVIDKNDRVGTYLLDQAEKRKAAAVKHEEEISKKREWDGFSAPLFSGK